MLFKWIRISAIIIFILIAVHALIIIVAGLRDTAESADLIVVFGNQVYVDGTVSWRLEKRLDQAIELFEKKYAPIILVSGGVGKSGYPEGDAMKKYLIEKNIPKSAIVTDNDGVNTWATVKNISKLSPKTKSVILVSQYYHLPRARYAAKKIGIEQVFISHADLGFELREVYSILREIPANYAYRFGRE